MAGSPAPRWWRRRRDLALAAARTAQARAAIALLTLDDAQRSAFSHLDFLANVDAGPIAVRIRTAWAPVTAAADGAIHAYLDALAHWDVTSDLELEQASAAAPAFEAHAAVMNAVTADIAAFSERFTPDFVSVTRTLEDLVPRRRAAERAVQEASTALAAAQEQGLQARRARELLDRAVGHLQVVQAGPVEHSMERVLRACGDTVAAAHDVLHDIEQQPGLRRRVLTSVASLRTRLAAVEWRAERGSAEVLRLLRMGYVEGCWLDVEDGARRAAAALDLARREVDAAVTAGSDAEQRWDDALAAVSRTRAALGDAEEHVDAPRDRLALLQTVSADPSAVHARARFAVRDAQKLLMAGSVDARHAFLLDALAARLDDAETMLDRPHPHWLDYAHTLDAIVDEARGLVVDIRASRVR